MTEIKADIKSSLPKDWRWVKLGDVCDVVTGTTPPKADLSNYGIDVPFFKPPHLWDGIINDTEEKLSFKGSQKARVVPPNTVLVTCIGNLGRTGFVKKSSAFNQQLNAILENENIGGKFIFYQAQSPLFKRQLEELATGTTVSIVNKGNFETIGIPLAPLPAQAAIVSKIEELLSEVDKGVENLRTAQQQLKTYRQAVLKWAFEGRLTNENVKDGELPEGWRAVTILSVIDKVETVKRKEKKPSDQLIYLDIGGIDNLTNKILTHKLYTWKDAPSRAQQIVHLNDTLFSTVRTYMKNIAFIDKVIYDKQIASSGFCVLRGKKEKINSKYLFYYSISDIFLRPLNELQTGSSYPAVRDKDVLSQYIPICSLTEQSSIIELIEQRFSVADKMGESINQSLQQAERLKQSILKKAFEGKLI